MAQRSYTFSGLLKQFLLSQMSIAKKILRTVRHSFPSFTTLGLNRTPSRENRGTPAPALCFNATDGVTGPPIASDQRPWCISVHQQYSSSSQHRIGLAFESMILFYLALAPGADGGSAGGTALAPSAGRARSIFVFFLQKFFLQFF